EKSPDEPSPRPEAPLVVGGKAAAGGKAEGPTSPAGKAAGKGPPPALGKGKGPTYKERKEQELRELEDKLSAAEGFCGQDLTVEEAKVINERGTEQAW
ncbi:unnamed protein product, partial [Polarella glacialis]